MTKVLILGYKGTLGQEMVKLFSKLDYELTAWDREDLDITGPGTKTKIISLHPDIIINATGYNAVDKAESDPTEKELCFKLNTEAVQNLAESAKQIDAIFVNYSTDFVFRGDKTDGYKEDDQPDPISVYGESKFEGEKRVKAVGGKYYIIRPARIFGVPGIGKNSKKSFVDVIIEKKELPEIKVVNEEKGSPTYAPDLAKFTFSLIAENRPYGIYHGTNSGVCSWYELAKEAYIIIGADIKKLIPVPRSAFPRPAKEPLYAELINTKMPPQPTWQDGLRRYLVGK